MCLLNPTTESLVIIKDLRRKMLILKQSCANSNHWHSQNLCSEGLEAMWMIKYFIYLFIYCLSNVSPILFIFRELFRLEEVSGAEWKAAILPYCSPSKCEDSQQKYSSLMQYILSFGEDLKGIVSYSFTSFMCLVP